MLFVSIFSFEKFPYDCFSTGEENVLMFIKLMIGFKITYDKIMGINSFSVINLIVGLFTFYRLVKTIGSSKYIVNHIYLKTIKLKYALSNFENKNFYAVRFSEEKLNIF